MQTTTRKTILNKIKDDIVQYLTVANGYETTIQDVRVGMYIWEDFNIKPAVSFYCDVDEIEAYEMGRSKIRLMNIEMWLWNRTDGVTNTTKIYDFAEDVENFLESSDFTYSDDVVMSDTEIYTGGVQDNAAIALVKFQIRYKQT
jgi:hypothetical protein